MAVGVVGGVGVGGGGVIDLKVEPMNLVVSVLQGVGHLGGPFRTALAWLFGVSIIHCQEPTLL